LGLADADDIGDHDQTSRDPDERMEGQTGHGDKYRHRLDDSKPGSNGAFGVAIGIAKTGENAVAHILRDKPPLSSTARCSNDGLR
jgi:hypothetical protein